MSKRPLYKELKQRIAELELELAALRKNNIEELKSLAERSQDAIYHFDLNLRNYLYFNKIAVDLFGEANTVTTKTVLLHIHPKDREKVKKASIDSLAPGCYVGEVEYRYQTSDGTFRWMHDRWIVKRDSSGKPSAIEGIVRDNTAHKQSEEALQKSEEKFRLILENSMDAIFFTAPDGRVFSANRAACEMTGYTENEIIELGRQAVIDPDDPRLSAALEERRSRGRFMGEINLKRKDGSRFPVEISSAVFKNEKEQERTIIIARDITERKRSEEEKKDLQSRLFLAQKMKALGTLVAGVAHEINNPINLIMLNVTLLQKVWQDLSVVLVEQGERKPSISFGGLSSRFLKENLMQLFIDMEIATNRVAGIIQGLKNFAKQSNVLEKGSVHVNEAVENMMRLSQASVRKSGVRVDLDLFHDLPRIEANLQALEQIIMNLLVNAVEAIEHDRGLVKVATGIREGKRSVYVAVSDNGRGIDPEIGNHIFEPFFTDRQSKGGTGLGLYITQSLAAANGGEITFRSEKGKGTTFTVTFPQAKSTPFKTP